MSHRRRPSTTAQTIIDAQAAPPQVERLGLIAGRFVHAHRLIALHEPTGHDPVPELAAGQGSVEVAAKALILTQTSPPTGPEPNPCLALLLLPHEP